MGFTLEGVGTPTPVSGDDGWGETNKNEANANPYNDLRQHGSPVLDTLVIVLPH